LERCRALRKLPWRCGRTPIQEPESADTRGSSLCLL